MKAKKLCVAVPAEMDNELATLTACKALLDRLGDLDKARRVVNYLNHTVTGDEFILNGAPPGGAD